jgi:hypothetical protein
MAKAEILIRALQLAMQAGHGQDAALNRKMPNSSVSRVNAPRCNRETFAMFGTNGQRSHCPIMRKQERKQR